MEGRSGENQAVEDRGRHAHLSIATQEAKQARGVGSMEEELVSNACVEHRDDEGLAPVYESNVAEECLVEHFSHDRQVIDTAVFASNRGAICRLEGLGHSAPCESVQS
jgi:hypothetical protein